MDNRPLVSICIPTYNGAEFLEQALDSVLRQSYKNIELVVSDDGSIDQTLTIVNEFKTAVKFPVKIINHNPKGIGANWNNCIKNSSGEYIKFLFQDDILYSTCIQELVKILIKNKNIGLVACKRSILVEGKVTEEIETWKRNYGNLQKGYELYNAHYHLFDKRNLKDEKFLKNNKVGEPTTVLFKKSHLHKTGLFREDLVQVLDLEFYNRFLKYFKIAILDKELAAFRLHPAQATNMNLNKISEEYDNYYKLLYKNFFFYLSISFQKKLFKRYHPVGKLYCYLRN